MDDKTMNRLRELNACDEAMAWVATQPDAQTAWDACQNPQWMLWLLGKTCSCESKLRLLAADFAESVLHLVEERHRETCAATIATARAYARGEASRDQLADARDDARAAARDDARAAAMDAAWAATWAAAESAAWAAAEAAAWDAAWAAAEAAARDASWAATWDAAWAAAEAAARDASWAATWAAARDAARDAQCAMIRKCFPTAPIGGAS